MVRALAVRMLSRLPASIELDDLIQVGMIGLHEASQRWKETGDAEFLTFAYGRITGAMLDECRRNDYLPRDVRKKLRAVDSTAQLLAHKLGRVPRDSETANALGMSLEAYLQLISEQVYTLSIQDEHDMPDEGANPEDRLRGYRMHKALVEALKTLPEREQFAMSMYYEHDMKLREIGAVLGVTESRVSHLLRDVSLKLRDQLCDH